MSVVEVATFRLAAGHDEASFLSADTRVQRELVPNRPGFVRRTTARRGADWLVVTLWASDGAATAADEAAEGQPVWLEFLRHLEPGSLVTRRFDTLD